MLGRSLLVPTTFILIAFWLIEKNEILQTTTVMMYHAVPGFFGHDEEPTGPQFRAVSLPMLSLPTCKPNLFS